LSPYAVVLLLFIFTPMPKYSGSCSGGFKGGKGGGDDRPPPIGLIFFSVSRFYAYCSLVHLW